MRFMIAVVVFIAVTPAVAPAVAQTVRAPRLTPGDTWTYENAHDLRGVRRSTHDMITLLRADSRMIDVEIRPAGSPNPGKEQLIGPDWSRVRSVNGVQTVVNRPLAYPLTPGKSWAVDYAETTPADRAHTREQMHIVYKVAGWEDVTVPAGTFHVVRIEGDGTWMADLPSNTLVAGGRTPNGGAVVNATRQAARVASGRFLKTFWYAPEVHRWVKSDEEFFDSNGTRTEQSTSDLEAFTLADPAGAAAEAEPPEAAPPPAKHVRAHKAARAPAAATAPAPKTPAKPHPAAPALPPLQETRAIGRHIPAAG